MKHKKFVFLIVVLAIIVLGVVYMKIATEASEDVNTPIGCAALWIDDVNTLEETMDCINYNIEKNNSIQSGSGNYST